ncbi:DUF2061 domain-containing protein [Marinoscillum sp.]|uniref:DUF2061 domain-containing protein n=1 Tax=Marinoscillum sp. TaxID=2024838 RepID=UPI003BA8A283
MDRSKFRHILKAVTWRIIASLTTFCLAYFFFKEDPEAIKKATWVAIAETVIKIALYYLHERVWYQNRFGVENKGARL